MILILFAIVAGLLAIGLLCDTVFRKQPARQDAVWQTILVGVILVPLIFIAATSFLPDGLVALPVLEPHEPSSATEIPELDKSPPQMEFNDYSASDSFDPAMVFAPPTAGTGSTTNAVQTFSIWSAMKALWMFGSIGLLGYFVAGWIGLQRLKESGRDEIPMSWRPIIRKVSHSLGLKKPLNVHVSKLVHTPMVVGILRAVVLVPESLTKAKNDSKVEAVLMHEAIHVARRDTWWNLMLCLAVAVWWPIPLVFLMRKRMNWLRELLCDIGVAGRMEVTQYAEVLLEMATLQQPRRVSLVAIPMKSQASMLESRIQWIFTNSLSIVAPSRRLVFTIGIALLGVSATLATVRFVPQIATAVQDDETSSDSRTLTGVIHGPDEQVVADALVYLYHAPDGRYSLSSDPEPLSTTSDNLGRYEFEDLKSGEYRVWAEASGLISLDHIFNGEKFVVPENGEFAKQVDLALHEGCNYEVAVVDSESQQPIADAEVTFGYADAPRSFRTDDKGMASIRGLPICGWYFVVKADGYGTIHKPTSKQEMGTTTKLRMELGKGSGVFGELTDQFGNSIADARVYVSSDELGMAPAYARTETDSEGNFAINGLPTNEKLRIQMGKDDYKFGTFYIELTKPGEPEEIYVDGEKLPYGGDVIVTVVDENGEPIQGIELINRGNGSGRTRNATTDSKGIGRLENMYHYQGCHIALRGQGMVPKSVKVEPGTQEDPETLTVELKPGKTIRGRVVDPEGEPIERVMLMVYAGIDFVTLEDLKWERIYSDADGKFEISGLKEPTQLRIMPSYSGDFREIKGFEIDFEKEEQLIELQYGAELRLRAVDRTTGEAIPEFNVKLDLVDFGRKKPGDIPNGVMVTYQEPGVNIHGDTKEFRLRAQPLQSTFKVIVSAEGYQTKTIHRMEAKVKPDLMDIKLNKK